MIKNCPEKARRNPRPRYSGPSSTQPQDNNTHQLQGQRNANPQTDHFHIYTHLNPQQFHFDPQATIVQGNASLSTQVGPELTADNEKRPADNVFDNKIRTGYIGEVTSNGDNGFYTKAFILNCSVHFLIDNGSTSTIVSYKKYKEIRT